VLVSTTTVPGAAPASRPSAPPSAARQAGVAAQQVLAVDLPDGAEAEQTGPLRMGGHLPSAG
jgi:hypothetical protein